MNWLEIARRYIGEQYEKNSRYESALDKEAFIDARINELSNVELLGLMEEIGPKP